MKKLLAVLLLGGLVPLFTPGAQIDNNNDELERALQASREAEEKRRFEQAQQESLVEARRRQQQEAAEQRQLELVRQGSAAIAESAALEEQRQRRELERALKESEAIAESLREAQQRQLQEALAESDGKDVFDELAADDAAAGDIERVNNEIKLMTSQLEELLPTVSPTNIPTEQLMKTIKQKIDRLMNEEQLLRGLYPEQSAAANLFGAAFALQAKFRRLKSVVNRIKQQQPKISATETIVKGEFSPEELRLGYSLIANINDQGKELDKLIDSISPERFPTDQEMRHALASVATAIREAKKSFNYKKLPPDLAQAIEYLRQKRAGLRRKYTQIKQELRRRRQEAQRMEDVE